MGGASQDTYASFVDYLLLRGAEAFPVLAYREESRERQRSTQLELVFCGEIEL